MSKSYTPPDRSTYDPGWNDPPPMPGNSVVGPPKMRLSLNKRIAYPQTGTSNPIAANIKTTSEGLPLPFSTAKYQPGALPSHIRNEISATTSNVLPPPMVSVATPSSLSTTNITENVNNQSVDLNEAFEYCNKIFSQTYGTLAIQMSNDKISGIQKRIDAMYGMWNENKLNELVKHDLYSIAKAIDEQRIEDAMEIHRKLIMNHLNVCVQWGTALRQLILSLDNKTDLKSCEAIDEPIESTQVPFLAVDSTQNAVNLPEIVSSSTTNALESTESVKTPSATLLIDNTSPPEPLENQILVQTQSVEQVPLAQQPKSDSRKNFSRILHL